MQNVIVYQTKLFVELLIYFTVMLLSSTVAIHVQSDLKTINCPIDCPHNQPLHHIMSLITAAMTLVPFHLSPCGDILLAWWNNRKVTCRSHWQVKPFNPWTSWPPTPPIRQLPPWVKGNAIICYMSQSESHTVSSSSFIHFHQFIWKPAIHTFRLTQIKGILSFEY